MQIKHFGSLVALWGGLFTLLPGADAMPDTSHPAVSSAPADVQRDTRAVVPPLNLDTHRTFPQIANRAEWEARRQFIHNQILVSCGLYPLPPKTPLRTHLFDRVEREGYTIEKVSFQTHPGFYLAGNLYRPFPSKAGHKYPGVLVAHGHWGEGRMADNPDGSIAARAITFARQGYVAFTYDMVGYNDTRQIDHRFANDAKHWLWGVSLMGLQTWNSIRALDFLSSLPEVDRSRLAITGESGGGTQTMILGAVDDRLAAVGPCVMVSHTMQGGCLCENAPGLRVAFSNMEVAAAAAPRYQIMVGATGDWTTTTLTVEGPAVASIYRLLGKEERVKAVCYDYGHNINKTSREAVYAWFGKWLLSETDEAKLKEPPYQREPVEQLRVFPNNTPLPADAKKAPELSDYLIRLGQSELERRKPHDRRSLTLFKKTYLPAWKHTLAVETPAQDQLWNTVEASRETVLSRQTRLTLGRHGRGDSIPALLLEPKGSCSSIVVLAHPKGIAAHWNATTQAPSDLVMRLLSERRAVLLLDAFLTGERADPVAQKARRVPFGVFFTTYNRTDMQERVQDLLTACAFLRGRLPKHKITLVGQEQAGLWTLLAAPGADAVSADLQSLDLTTDEALLQDDLYVPCLRRLGDFRTAATLAAPNPLLLHNTGTKFSAIPWIADTYAAVGASGALRVESHAASETQLLAWLTATTL